MRRFVLATAVGSARQVVAILVAAVAIGWAGYLGSHPLSNPSHLAPYQRCFGVRFNGPIPPPSIPIEIVSQCRPRSRFAWQIPVAVLLGLAGIGSAAGIAGRRRPQRRLPDGVSQSRLARI